MHLLVALEHAFLGQLKVDVREVKQECACFRHLATRVKFRTAKQMISEQTSELIARDLVTDLRTECILVLLKWIRLFQLASISDMS